MERVWWRASQEHEQLVHEGHEGWVTWLRYAVLGQLGMAEELGSSLQPSCIPQLVQCLS